LTCDISDISSALIHVFTIKLIGQNETAPLIK